LSRETKGREERGVRASYSIGYWWQLSRGDGEGVTPATLLETEEKPLEKNEPTGGSHLAARGREGKAGEAGWAGFGCGWLGPLARARPRWAAVFLFYFFLFWFIFPFLFSFSSITFAFVTQMTSNQIVKFSKIPSNNPEQ
jgi:hypothetical protein